ncbi:MAG: hypothetical protein JXA87_13070 [Thermoleophilia bacterium]|nr:hypothetical protein [Thermoleophilia bacterium]
MATRLADHPHLVLAGLEKAGSGILDMIALCADAGLRPPEFLQEGGQFIQRIWRPVAPQAGASSIGSPT